MWREPVTVMVEVNCNQTKDRRHKQPLLISIGSVVEICLKTEIRAGKFLLLRTLEMVHRRV